MDWNTHKQITNYAVDSTAQRQIVAGTTTFRIKREDFIDELYVNRTNDVFEKSLLTALQTNGPLFCIVGARGQGKTSALHWAQSQLSRNSDGIRTIIIVDIRKLSDITIDSDRRSDATTLNNLSSNPVLFRDVLRRKLLIDLFPKGRHAFIAWALAGLPDMSDSFDENLLIEFEDYAEVFRQDHDIHQSSRRHRMDAIETLLLADKTLYGSASAIIVPACRPAHVLQAYSSLKGKSLAIIYDNVDQLTVANQVALFREAEIIHAALASSCSTAIAIRDEAVRYTRVASGGGGAAIQVVLPNQSVHGGILLTESAPDYIRSIVNKRYALSRKRSSDTTDAGFNPDRIHEPVLDGLVAMEAIRLVNQSVRNFLVLYSEFLAFCHDRVLAKKLNINDKGNIETVFFLWLFQNGSRFGLEMQDVLQVLPDRPGDFDTKVSASAHHLLLTCLYNLESAAVVDPTGRAPTCAKVMARMQQLGFSPATIRNAIAELSGTNNGEKKAIEFVELDPTPEMLSPDSQHRMRLTCCGRELITRTYSRVGYVMGRVLQVERRGTHAGGGAAGSIDYFGIYDTIPAAERRDMFLRFLVTQMRKHEALLLSIKDTFAEKHGTDWIAVYKSKFAVDGMLQLHRIIDQAQRFFAHLASADKDPFLIAADKYTEIIRNLQSGQRLVEIKWQKMREEILEAVR